MKLFSKLPKEHVFQESDSDTCGPSCLAMVYAKKGKKIHVKDILKDFHQPEKGEPTYASQLARHLLKNGIQTKLTLSNSMIISPAWKDLPKEKIIENVKEWILLHPNHNWHQDALFTLFYLQEGGNVGLVSYTFSTLKKMLDQGSFIIVGVDEDWIWGHRFKKKGNKRVIDDIEGSVAGHFILITGYSDSMFHVLDPFPTGIKGRYGAYDIDADTVVNASLFWGSTVLEILA